MFSHNRPQRETCSLNRVNEPRWKIKSWTGGQPGFPNVTFKEQPAALHTGIQFPTQVVCKDEGHWDLCK